MKKDLIEIVTIDRKYYIKENYEAIKIELESLRRSDWVEFDKLTEMYYLSQEQHDIDKLLLRVGNIIAIHKLHEWSDGS